MNTEKITPSDCAELAEFFFIKAKRDSKGFDWIFEIPSSGDYYFYPDGSSYFPLEDFNPSNDSAYFLLFDAIGRMGCRIDEISFYEAGPERKYVCNIYKIDDGQIISFEQKFAESKKLALWLTAKELMKRMRTSEQEG